MLFFFIFMDEFINYYIALLIIIQKKTKIVFAIIVYQITLV